MKREILKEKLEEKEARRERERKRERERESLPHLVGDVLVLIQEHLELADTDAEVTVSELIWDVEPQWAKLSALNGITVEQTQRQEQGLKLCSLEERRNRGQR